MSACLCRSLTAERLAEEGFQQPLWVQTLEDTSVTLKACVLNLM